MNRTITVVCLSLLIFPPVNGDFDSAAEAYRQRNYPAAFEEFQRLAGEGDARAQTVLALMYKFGEAVKRDPEKSFHWYKKAAVSGYPPAQFHLGIMYVEGTGTQRDRESGIRWLEISANNGFERARTKLIELEEAPVSPRDERQSPTWSQSWNFRLPNDIRYPDDSDRTDEPWRVQLAATATRRAANLFWETLRSRSGGLLAGLNPRITTFETDDDLVYRVQAGPFENLTAAREFCDALKRRRPGTDCFPLR